MNISDDILNRLLDEISGMAIDAGKIILDIYKSDFSNTIVKKTDNSPLTIADKNANDYIVEELGKMDTVFPILAEESTQIDYDNRKNFEYFWLVDPLDGTKEFINKNGEFTVNIALIHKNTPVLGVVYIPVQDKLYFAAKNYGAYLKCDNKTIKLNKRYIDFKAKNLKILVSRSHFDNKTKKYIKKFDNPVVQHRGSALKFLLVAEGKADLYLRFTPTMEWDTAASHIILNETGIELVNINTGDILKYNKYSLVNPGFITKTFK